jgi:thiol-disulfide isomerase/thioredoxin
MVKSYVRNPGFFQPQMRYSIYSACFAMLVACVGCSKPVAPARPPAPVFKMPSTGEASDSSLWIGDKFPEIQSVDLDGNALTLGQALLGDRYSLIVFWATDCGFCMAELPHEVELARQYESAGLRVIGINAGDTGAIARDAAKKNGLPWLNVLEGPDRPISDQLGIKQLPTLLLLDHDGKVICATPELRTIAAEALPDGTARQINCLDWVLSKLLGDK